ncbi:unnamed protein product, partial [Brachionus calyciflorus]
MFLLSNNYNKLNRILKTTTCIQKFTIHNTAYLFDTKNTDKASNPNKNESKTPDSRKNLKAKYAKMSFISLNDSQNTFSSYTPKQTNIPKTQTQKQPEKNPIKQNVEPTAKTQSVYTPSISLQFTASTSQTTETPKETQKLDVKIDNNLKEKLEKKSIPKDFENQLENKANEVAKLVNKNKDEQRKTTEEILGPVLNPKLLDQLKKKAINKANNNIPLNEPTIEKLNRNDKEYRNFLKKAENFNEIKKDENVVRREKVDKRKVPFWAESPYQKFQNLSGGNGLALFGSDFKPVVTTTLESPIWSMHHDEQLKLAQQSLPINGFDELIQLTNEGKIWKFPIDNEQ